MYLPEIYGVDKYALWNLQLGVPGDINGEKLHKMPQGYFRSRQNVLVQHYDFLPTMDVEEPIWAYGNVGEFWRARRTLMLQALKQLYGLDV